MTAAMAPDGQRLHVAAPRGHEPERVLEAQHAREAGCDVLADAVADHRGGLDAPVHPQPCERVLDGEDRGLGICRPLEQTASSSATFPRRVEEPAEVEADVGLQQLRAPIDALAEARLLAVHVERHVELL